MVSVLHRTFVVATFLALLVVVCVLIVAMQTIAAVSARLRGRTTSPVR